MRKTLSAIILIFGAFIFSPNPAFAGWQQDGSYLNVSPTLNAIAPSLAVSNSSPYVAWVEATDSSNGTPVRLNVKHWNSSNWIQDGNYLADGVSNVHIAAGGNSPYVLWQSGYAAYVSHLNGTNWDPFGAIPKVNSTYTLANPSLAIGNGNPYATWSETGTSNGSSPVVYAKHWNGNTWQQDGTYLSSGDLNTTSNYPSIAVYNGTPYVAFLEPANVSPFCNQLYVKYYNGSSWVKLSSTHEFGSLNIDQNMSGGNAYSPTIVFSNNIPYVAWYENTGRNRIYVKHWNGSDWQLDGTDYLNVSIYNDAGVPSLAIDNGRPYVAWDENSQIYMKHWNGAAWVQNGGSLNVVGTNTATAASIGVINGIPYVTWQEKIGSVTQIIVKHWIDRVCSADPVHAASGKTLSLNIFSEGFSGTPAVKLIRSGSPDITGQSIVKNSAYSTTATFNLGGAAPGVYDVQVALSEFQGTLRKAFSVLATAVGPFNWSINDLGQAGTPSLSGTYYGLDIGFADADGQQALYAANLDQKVYQFKKSGSTWNVYLLPVGAAGEYHDRLVVADGDGDQSVEVYAGLLNNHVYQYKGSAWQKTDVGLGAATSTKIFGLAKADLDHDGVLELYSAGDDGKVCRFTNNGSYWIKAEVSGSPAYQATFLIAGDGNGDKELELYSGNTDNAVYQYKYNGTAWNITPVNTFAGPIYGLAVGDGENNNKKQVYAACQDGRIYQCQWGVSSWSSQAIGDAVNNTLYAVAVSDGDNDGANEVYAACGDGHVYAYKFAGGAQWTRQDLGSRGTPLYALAIGDADNDNKFEVYALGQDNHVYQFVSAAAPTPTPTPAPTSAPTPVPPQAYVQTLNNVINPMYGEQTTIRWTQPRSGNTTVTIYNLIGEKTTVLAANQYYSSGQYNSLNWNGYNAAGNMVASGIYIVLLQAPGYQETGKIAVVK